MAVPIWSPWSAIDVFVQPGSKSKPTPYPTAAAGDLLPPKRYPLSCLVQSPTVISMRGLVNLQSAVPTLSMFNSVLTHPPSCMMKRRASAADRLIKSPRFNLMMTTTISGKRARNQPYLRLYFYTWQPARLITLIIFYKGECYFWPRLCHLFFAKYRIGMSLICSLFLDKFCSRMP